MSLPISLDAIVERNQQVSAAFSEMGDGEPMPTFMRDHFFYDVPTLVRRVHELEQQLGAVESLTKDTDGGDVDQDAEIPIGEIRRVLAEAATR
jgi:hypothetical protein